MSGTTAAALVLGLGPYTDRAWASPRFADDPFSLGVASGDPAPDGVVLWTRLAPDPMAGGGMPDAAVQAEWEVADDPQFRRVVRRGTETARPELGHAVHAEVHGLEPHREYYYRFRAGGQISPVGRTRTAPALGAAVGALRFAFVSCQQFEHGYYTAYGHLAEEDLDLVVHLGDYIYEYGTDEYLSPDGNVRHHVGAEIWSLEDYRIRHAQYRGDADLQAAHAACPWMVTWDDHEVENNYAGLVPEQGQDPALFLPRRAAAYQAYYEHMPLRRSSVPRGPDMLLYRRLPYGGLADFHLLDTRQYRDDQAAGDGTKPPNPEQQDPSRTLTGAEQEAWLLDGLARSGARWNVLAQQVFFARRDLGVGADERYSMDSWDGYLGSRDRIVRGFAETGASNPVVLTGDVHASWANDVKADFADPGSATVATEFVGTSITSGGNGSDTRADTAQVLADNPHIRFFNNFRGYVRCTVTPRQWQTDYRVVPYVTQPGAPVSTRASFVVETGRPGVQTLSTHDVPGRQHNTETEQDRLDAQT
ncbi:MAG: alkaline phosphatase D family protein [Actinomycetes bacterium]